MVARCVPFEDMIENPSGPVQQMFPDRSTFMPSGAPGLVPFRLKDQVVRTVQSFPLANLQFCEDGMITGCPISDRGSASFLGWNFCVRPPKVSAAYRFPSESTEN